MTSIDTCISSHSRVSAGLLTALFSGLSACSLISIDPDEIDVADESSDGAFDEAAEEAAGTADAGDTSNTSEGTETSGDTTGDPSSTTDDGSDGPAETSGPDMCEAVDEVVLGENPVAIAAGLSAFQGSCGGSESETLYSFTAPADGDYGFSLVGAEFSAVLHVLDTACVESPNSCSNTADPVLKSLSGGEIVILVVDSDAGAGSATLVITGA